MKRLLFILPFLSLGLAFGQLAEEPHYEFKSTSTYQCTEYRQQHTLPMSELQQPFYNPCQPQNSVRKSPSSPLNDPGWEDTPVGDAIIPFTILVFVYFMIWKFRRRP